MLDFGLASEREIREELSSRLPAQRLAKGFGQADLAKDAGVGVATLQRLEAGQGGTLENFLRIVMALGLVDELTDLFTLKVRSIAQMERAAAQKTRQRAPRRKTSTASPGELGA
ncbi:helix-turn-helix domain-containing protein [Rhodoferax ferrireducens]|uniref:helix-turn-helix domain-containing protein n=1 Tax=Rhodoferax ferrireducens TaxID=192843 RepID=UPI0013004BCB|nr:helix-turn-helix transcriptional regulator [Rhodoferax ferrireducens]